MNKLVNKKNLKNYWNSFYIKKKKINHQILQSLSKKNLLKKKAI